MNMNASRSVLDAARTEQSNMDTRYRNEGATSTGLCGASCASPLVSGVRPYMDSEWDDERRGRDALFNEFAPGDYMPASNNGPATNSQPTAADHQSLVDEPQNNVWCIVCDEVMRPVNARRHAYSASHLDRVHAASSHVQETMFRTRKAVKGPSDKYPSDTDIVLRWSEATWGSYEVINPLDDSLNDEDDTMPTPSMIQRTFTERAYAVDEDDSQDMLYSDDESEIESDAE